MRFLQLSFAPKHVFRSEFATEWYCVVLLALATAIWAWSIGFDLTIRWHDVLPICAVVLLVLLARALNSERATLVSEYFLLTAIATATIGVASYLAMAADRPLADGALMAADRAIGFDWSVQYQALMHHAVAAKVLQIAYGSLVYQGLLFGVLFGLMGRRGDLRQMFWLVVISGLITCAGAAFFPALGPFKAHGIKAEFLPVMEQLRAGNLHFALSNLTGVVSFPSFHTTMALLFIYSFSRAGTIGWLLAMLNVVMLPSIPFFGGHYLVDMAGGAAVALGSLALVKAAARTSSGQHVTSGAYTGLFGVGMGHQREPAH